MTEVVPEPSWAVAFFAGMLSFLSPCIAPLAPGYLSYVAGTAGRSNAGQRQVTLRALSTSLLFMLGFTLVFVMLGMSLSLFSGFFEEQRSVLYRVSGGLMIAFGLMMTGLPRLLWLQRERRLEISPEIFGPAAPVLLGMAFAFAWTPCVGPILGSILLYAGLAETAGQGGLLLFVYSLGFGIPFVLAGLGFTSMLRFSGWVRRHYNTISAVSGAMLVTLGVMFLLGFATTLNIWMQRLTA